MKTYILTLITLFTISKHFGNDLKIAENCFKSNSIQRPMKIYLLGGIVSSITQKEIDFSKKYEISFHDFGCLAPTNLEYYEIENQKVFDWLNIRFGPKWQNEIKENALGFKKWKEKNY